MRTSLIAFVVAVAVGSLGAGVVASAHAVDGPAASGGGALPAAAFSLPGVVPCNVDLDSPPSTPSATRRR